ncbi:MAG: AsmA family protein [Methylobacter sp.]|nr:AsmA family protein [Methylobacter sp.]
MGKPFKIILSTIAAILLLLIAAACILPFVIDPNDFKPEIAAAVKDKTGRDLVLDGDLKLSLFPWIGISTEKIILSNAPGFQDRPFATIEESHVNVLLLPLLSKKLEVSRIDLKGLILNLARNKQGLTNWSDLIDSAAAKTAAPAAIDKQDEQPISTATPVTFTIGGIAVENARINWDDLKTEKHIEIKDLNLNTDKFTFDQPVGVAVSMTALEAGSKAVQAIKLNTELTVNEKLDSFALRHSDLQVTSSGETVPGKSLTTALTIADAALDMNQQTAKIYGLQLKSGDVTLVAAEMAGTSIKDKPSFQGPVAIASFSPAKVLQQLAISLPAMQDANALSKLSANFDLTATADSADLQNLALTLDDTQIKGFISVKDFAQSIINFSLDIDALDVDRYLSPADKSPKPIASPAVLLAVGLSALPVETLRKLNADGAVSLGKLKVNDLAMQDIHINLSSKNGVVTTQQSIKHFYQGSYSGNLSMDTHGSKSTLAVTEKIDHVQIEPLLKDYKGEAKMSGVVNASAQLHGLGHKADELKASLNGQLSFLFKDGMIKGFNLQKIIDEGKAIIKGSALPSDNKNDQTLFSEMSGTATITNGLIQNNDLAAKSSKLRVDGKGNVNLNSEALDYKIDAKLLDSEATATEPEQVKGAVAIDVAGTLSNPTYTINIASLLTDKNKAKVEKLIDKLDKKIGPGLGNLLKGLLR